MQKKGNKYFLDPLEKKIIKNLIDEKVGRKTKTTDYRNQTKDNISDEIKQKTGGEVGNTTLGRLTGVDKSERGTTHNSLDVVAEYLGYTDAKALTDALSEKLKKDKPQNNFSINDFFKSHKLRIVFDDDRHLELKFTNNNVFDVDGTGGIDILQKGDRVYVSSIKVGSAFECYNVTRVEALDKYGEKLDEISLGKLVIKTIETIELLSL